MTETLCSCGIPWKDIDDKCARCKRKIPLDRVSDLDLHRTVKDIGVCSCSETVMSSWGSRQTNFEGIYLCNFCDLKSSALTQVSEEPEKNDELTEEQVPQKQDVPIENRTAAQNLEVVESLINNLANTKKYRRAISGGEFAQFSLIGTNDWEDYASLSIKALELLTLAQINLNLESIRKSLEEK